MGKDVTLPDNDCGKYNIVKISLIFVAKLANMYYKCINTVNREGNLLTYLWSDINVCCCKGFQFSVQHSVIKHFNFCCNVAFP